MDFSAILENYIIPWGINILSAILIFFAGRYLSKGIGKIVLKILKKAKVELILSNFITTMTRVIILIIFIVASLNKLGVNTTSIVAILGAAGLAIGLALQGSLQNFAAGIMLILFRPFKNDDFVQIAGQDGIVDEIMIFSTRLKTPDNRELTIPNSSIFGQIITNYSSLNKRRLDVIFGISYDSSIKNAKEIIENILKSDERILKEPAPLVVVSSLGDSSVNLTARIWVKSADYLNVRFYLLETVKIAFDEKGITIPFPQVDVHMKQ